MFHTSFFRGLNQHSGMWKMKRLRNFVSKEINRHTIPPERVGEILEVIHEVTQLSVQDTDSERYVKQVCEILTRDHGYEDAWAGLLGGSGETTNFLASCATPQRLKRLGELAPKNLPRCSEQALTQQSIVYIEEPTAGCAECSLSSLCAEHTVYCACLRHGATTYGFLAGTIRPQPAGLGAPKELLQAIASNAAMALHTADNERARIQAEITKHRSEQRLDLALKGANLGLWDWNLQTGEVVFDDRWAEMLGFLHSDNRDEARSWENLIHIDDMPRVSEVLRAHFAGETPYYESEHRLRAKSGEWKWVLDRGRIVERSAEGTPLRATGTILDITLRKKTEEERERLADQLRQAQKIESIGRLAGGIAHDLNNMLSPIIGYSEMALMDLHPEEALHSDMSEIRDAAERAKTLTQQLLAFSRKQVLKMRLLSLNDVISESKKLLRRLTREDIEMRVRLDPSLGTIKADSSQIHQILINLALNASDAMPNGGRMTIGTANVSLDEVYVAKRPVVEAGHYVLLSVSDTGIGMDQETLSHIFEPFFTTKEKGRGTGLGLATVYGIVKQHGGYIWAYSEPGYGTNFKIYLPRVLESRGTPWTPSSEPEDVLGGETILVVEDEDAVRKLTCKILEKQGYDVIEAHSADDAARISEHEKSPIHMLLTDIVMPGMNGKQLYEIIAKSRPEIKILYMSGYTDDVIAYHGILDAGVRLLQKPFSVETLTKKIRKVLDEE